MVEYDCPLGFKAMALKFKADSSAQHMIFVKQHTVREKHPDKPSDRTLFVLNVPPYCTEESMKHAWHECGPARKVYFHSRPNSGVPGHNESIFFPTEEKVKGFKVAYIVFEKPESLLKALKWNCNQPLLLSSSDQPLICGVQKWCQDYNSRIPNISEMQCEVDKFMIAYDKKVEKQIADEKLAGEEDEDGWVTVTKRGRRPGFARTEKVNKKVKALEEKKRSKKQLLNFYSFQVREAKMKNLMSLRQKFEEDKKKIQMLKQIRKFKPF